MKRSPPRDVADDRPHAPEDIPEANYESRRNRAARQAATLRRLLEEDEPIRFSETYDEGERECNDHRLAT